MAVRLSRSCVLLVVLCALLACKKSDPTPTASGASASAAPPAPAATKADAKRALAKPAAPTVTRTVHSKGDVVAMCRSVKITYDAKKAK